MSRIFLLLLLAAVCSMSVLGCAGSSREEDADGSSADTPVNGRPFFTDITRSAGLADFRHSKGAIGKKWMPETLGSGAGFIDYNGDGLLDILLVGGGVWTDYSNEIVEAVRIYRNEGGGRFQEVTAEVGLGGVQAYGMGVTVADYDNDGDDDFYFTTLNHNMLFRNEGGRFVEVAEQAGAAGPDEWSTCSVFFDADRDGHLDLYACGYVVWPPERNIDCYLGDRLAYCAPEDYTGMAGRYFHNEGDGTFAERTSEAGFLSFGGKSLGAVEIDIDKDGWMDLVVANDSERNLLYHNDGDGTFTEKGVRAGVAYDERGGARGGMGIDAGDITGNGTTSILIGNFSEQMIGVFEQTDGILFRDRAAASQIGQPTFLTLTFGLFLFDVDLDGDLDLFAANGHIQERYNEFHDNITYRQAPQLFINQGGGTFEEFQSEPEGPLAQELVARGAAYADIDADGDQDVLLTESAGPVHLWRNDTNGGNYLRVELQGRASNRGGLGACVVAYADGERQERWIQSGGSYLSASEQVATFGLPNVETVDSLKVHWPSGNVDRLINISTDQHLRITEGTDTGEPIRSATVRSQS